MNLLCGSLNNYYGQIVGAGSSGLSAARTAQSMGAKVIVYDNRKYSDMRDQVQALGGDFYEEESDETNEVSLRNTF